MTVAIIIGVVILIILIFVFATYNNLIRLKNLVKEAFATMDVYLKKRWDLIPNLVEIVKGYAKHEKGTLMEVIELRNRSYDTVTMEEKMSANPELGRGINKIFALAESYPDLKASTNFLNL